MKVNKPFYIKRISYISLLETLVAMSLLSILLTIVFGFFRQLSGMSDHMEKQQKESFQVRYLESRLAFIFERIVNENETHTRKFYFYLSPTQKENTSFDHLIFTFDNEVRLDPHFSGDVLGCLYVDGDHRFCLAVWPLHTPQPHQSMREEVLLENVADIAYEFYAPPEQIEDLKEVSTKTIDPKQPEKDKWHQEWRSDYEQMPAIVKMKISVAKNPNDLKHFTPGTKIDTTELFFSFVLPSSKNPIQYPPLNQ